MNMTMPSGRRFTLAFCVLLGLGIGLSYLHGMNSGFYFDGIYGITNNPAIRSLSNIPSFFIDPYAAWTESTQVDLRPFVLISFAVNYAISGLEPWSYHALNLVLHFISAMLVFFIVRDLLWFSTSDNENVGDARIPAAIAALFFALAPLNSQPVNYIWARSSLLCVTLYLAAFLSFVRCRWILAALFFTLALLTKAIAVTLPATLLLYDYIYRDRSKYPSLGDYTRDWKRLLPLIGIPALLAIGYVLYRAAFLPSWTEEARRASWVTPWTWFMSQWSALLYYVRLYLWPNALSIDHDFPYATSFLATRAWLSLLVLLTWITLAWGAVKRYPIVTFATGWFFITLSPVSTLFPLAEVINDHRPYIATSLGLAPLLTWGLYKVSRRLSPRTWQPAFVSVAILLVIPAIGFNRYRTWQWQDELRLWEATVHKSPKNGRAWMNAGILYMERGELATARSYFEHAKELAPQYAYIFINLSILDAHEGDLDKALAAAEEARRLRPNLALAHFRVGKALELLGRRDEALLSYEKAVELNPRYTAAQEAIKQLQTPSSELDASSQIALMKAGVKFLYEQDQPVKAVEEFRSVLKSNPDHYGATYQLAVALDRLGKTEEAHSYWERVLVMAEKYNDKKTAATARSHLKKSP